MSGRLRREWCVGLTLAVLALGPQSGHACSRPPSEQLIGVDEQIAQATDVSVATVVRASLLDGGRVQYDFVVLKRLHGPDQPEFSLVGMTRSSGEMPVGSNDHGDSTFWKYGGGRLMNSPDCRIHPRFMVGESYLIFNQQPTWRSYERIAIVNGKPLANDQWLQYVEAKLNGKDVPPEWQERARQRYPWDELR
ncbi:MAG: hypothetical protein ACREWI_08150 [Telluria sp.]